MTEYEAIKQLKIQRTFANGSNAKVEAIDMAIKELEKHITKKPKTNADRIRAMSDGELADFLYDCSPSCEYGCPARVEGCYEDCMRAIEEWLKQEVEDAGSI